MERFYCLDCRWTGPLNLHGQCGACDSNSVASEYAGNLGAVILQHKIDQDVEKIFEISGVK